MKEMNPSDFDRVPPETTAGLRLLKEARKVLIRIERAHRAVRETDARFRAPLRIGVADGMRSPNYPSALSAGAR